MAGRHILLYDLLERLSLREGGSASGAMRRTMARKGCGSGGAEEGGRPQGRVERRALRYLCQFATKARSTAQVGAAVAADPAEAVLQPEHTRRMRRIARHRRAAGRLSGAKADIAPTKQQSNAISPQLRP